MDATLRQLTASALVGSLVGVGLFACSRDKARATDSAALSSAAAPSSDSAGTAVAPPSDSATIDAGTVSLVPPAESIATLPSPATTKHAGRTAHRSGHVTTTARAKPLKREGIPCVPLAGDSPQRADFSSSPPGVNPCGVGSMNLPTMAPKPAAPR